MKASFNCSTPHLDHRGDQQVSAVAVITWHLARLRAQQRHLFLLFLAAQLQLGQLPVVVQFAANGGEFGFYVALTWEVALKSEISTEAESPNGDQLFVFFEFFQHVPSLLRGLIWRQRLRAYVWSARRKISLNPDQEKQKLSKCKRRSERIVFERNATRQFRAPWAAALRSQRRKGHGLLRPTTSQRRYYFCVVARRL
ncbi:MAG: hypothetical protein ACI9I0_002357 [Rhodoferax sp.]